MEPMDAVGSNESAMAMHRKRWLLENNVQTSDSIFKYDKEEQASMRGMKPWERDPNYFKEVKMSALALLKMVIHAQSGGQLEIMGMMQGRVEAHTLIVMDSFALPVEGTETRVNAQSQAYEYMTTYTESCEAVGRMEKVVGWYHSHPGYGCWLSGIDVSTQTLNQQYMEPFVAVVAASTLAPFALTPKVANLIMCERAQLSATRIAGYKPPDESPSEYQSIPLNKVEDFGVHCKNYYPLNISYFKSSLDSGMLNAMWSTYWTSTLASNPLRTNAQYLTSQAQDLAAKLEQVGNKNSALFAERLTKATKDGQKLGCEVVQGLMGECIKHAVFHHKCKV